MRHPMPADGPDARLLKSIHMDQQQIEDPEDNYYTQQFVSPLERTSLHNLSKKGFVQFMRGTEYGLLPGEVLVRVTQEGRRWLEDV